MLQSNQIFNFKLNVEQSQSMFSSIINMIEIYASENPPLKTKIISLYSTTSVLPHNLERRNLEFPQPRDPQPRGSIT